MLDFYQNCCSATRKKKSLNQIDSRILIKSRVGFYGGEGGIFRSISRLAALLRTLAPFRSLPCGARNSPPDCFSAPFKSTQNKTKKPYFVRLLCFGGEGSLPSVSHTGFYCFFIIFVEFRNQNMFLKHYIISKNPYH